MSEIYGFCWSVDKSDCENYSMFFLYFWTFCGIVWKWMSGILDLAYMIYAMSCELMRDGHSYMEDTNHTLKWNAWLQDVIYKKRCTITLRLETLKRSIETVVGAKTGLSISAGFSVKLWGFKEDLTFAFFQQPQCYRIDFPLNITG